MDNFLNVTSGRTEGFEDVAIELGDFITQLPISNEQNNQLISLIIQQIAEAEVGAFRFGIQIMGLAMGLANKENREIEEDDLRSAYALFMAKKEAAENSKISH